MQNLSKTIFSFCTLLLLLVSVSAKGVRPAGELASASGATINSTTAHSGTTIFSNSRVKTAANGSAIINLGLLGRVELGPNSDLTLQFSRGVLGGTLSSGKIAISTLSGVQVNLTTPDGSVTSASPQAARFVVDLTNGKTNVVANRGAAKLLSGGRVSVIGVVNAGQVQGISRNAAEPARATSGADPKQDANMANLLRATSNQAVAEALANRASKQLGGLYYTSITCKDFFDNPKCVKRSPTR